MNSSGARSAIRQCDEAMRNFERYGSRKPVPHVTDETPDGERARAELGRGSPRATRWRGKTRSIRISAIATQGSPIIVPDGPTPPDPDDTRVYTQTSHPGCRAPHAWLGDGRSTLDLFGRHFTLLRLGI